MMNSQKIMGRQRIRPQICDQTVKPKPGEFPQGKKILGSINCATALDACTTQGR
jgi:hypothetical protein